MDNKILDFIVRRFSFQSIALGDLEILMDFSKDKDLVVELGTCVGTTSEVFIKNGVQKVITIDVFEKLDLVEDSKNHEIYVNNWNQFPHTFLSVRGRLKMYPNIEVYQGRSYDLSHLCEDNSVDMIFIDADHSYKGAQKDYDAWFNKIKVGGNFLFHDVISDFGVYKFYNEVLVKDKRIVEVPIANENFASIKAFRKL